MCLAIPGKILYKEGDTGKVELGGVTREVGLQLVPESKAGDWVLLHAGFAIQVVDEEEAQATLDLLEEFFKAETEDG
ncbi:MAG: HypC/HybG/HupF family hydrogenase formation chaperone [Spirochaetes bacterium]|nr:HypC/HybG/HupF family hydrogenase formation chaperone [Spirochaetota bacterium]